MASIFAESKATLYDFIDRLDQKGWSDQFVSSVKNQVRHWLLDKQVTATDVLALSQSMGLTEPEFAEFTNLLYGQIGLLEVEENQQANITGRSKGSNQAFHLMEYARKFPKISKEDAAENVKVYQDSLKAKEELESHGENISDTEARRLKAMVRKGKDAQEKLIVGNWGLIMSMALKYGNMGVSEEDLCQEGVMGLIRAMQSFIPQKAAFSTYATPWVKKHILIAVTEQGRPIPLSPNTASLLSRINRAAADHEARNGVAPTVEDLSELTGISARQISNATRNERQSQSLSIESMAMDHGDGCRILDMIEDPNAEHQYNSVLEQDEEVDIRRVLHKALSPLEEKIALLRFGIEDGQPKSLEDMGVILGYSKENVRQIEKKALARLKDENCLDKFYEAMSQRSA